MWNPIALDYIKVSHRKQYNLLFNLYINDLNKQTPADTKTFQYADDTIILAYKTDLKLAAYYREQSLRNISEYYEKLRLMPNHSKTEFIAF